MDLKEKFHQKALAVRTELRAILKKKATSSLGK